MDEHGTSAADDLEDLLDSVLDDFQKVERGASVGQGLGLGLPPLRKKAVSQKRSEPQSSTSKTETVAVSPASKSNQSSSSSHSLGATLEKLRAETRQTVENIDANHEDDIMGNELVDNLVKQFEDLGGSQDMQSIMDTMMHQLLSKEVLYEPMKEIGERYPQWLAGNKSHLSEGDYSRYSRQYEHIKQLCFIYENTPDDFQKVVDLMQRMQNCGQPPSDIIRELAPGLELGDDGLPMLPDLNGAGGGLGALGNSCSMM